MTEVNLQTSVKHAHTIFQVSSVNQSPVFHTSQHAYNIGCVCASDIFICFCHAKMRMFSLL
jgi:hypothetical protein